MPASRVGSGDRRAPGGSPGPQVGINSERSPELWAHYITLLKQQHGQESVERDVTNIAPMMREALRGRRVAKSDREESDGRTDSRKKEPGGTPRTSRSDVSGQTGRRRGPAGTSFTRHPPVRQTSKSGPRRHHPLRHPAVELREWARRRAEAGAADSAPRVGRASSKGWLFGSALPSQRTVGPEHLGAMEGRGC